MKEFSIVYSPNAYRELKRIDTTIALRITAKIEHNVYQATHPLDTAKALSGVLQGLYRYRVGDYRVIFEIDEAGTISILHVLSIKHRKDVYR